MAFSKENRRRRIRYRVRKKVRGTANRPRISVFRSLRGIYAQAIDDVSAHTIASASSKDVEAAGNKSEQARKVGQLLAERAKSKGIDTVVFDRSGYLYHGRVKALAEGAREAGLNF